MSRGNRPDTDLWSEYTRTWYFFLAKMNVLVMYWCWNITCSTFKHWFQTWAHLRRTHSHIQRPDSPGSWCRLGPWGHPRGNERGRNPTPYTPDYCWPICCGQPSLCARSSYLTGTSFLQRFRAACRPAGWLWTARHWAGKRKRNNDRRDVIVDQGCGIKRICRLLHLSLFFL